MGLGVEVGMSYVNKIQEGEHLIFGGAVQDIGNTAYSKLSRSFESSICSWCYIHCQSISGVILDMRQGISQHILSKHSNFR